MTLCDLDMKVKTLQIWYGRDLALWHHMAQFEKPSFNTFFSESCPQSFTPNDHPCDVEMNIMITKS